ncbi:unnamed protein product [Phytomonas sp. EM1]|nr:unnamed protein product [Phytomonas sp. EM1]|eukprot:CCW63979.1 unnamed protein product [Phytomonas sp. isolate EM1]
MEAVTTPYRVVGLEYVAGGVARAISCGRQHTLVVMENPQPGCTQRCCQMDYPGKHRPSHAQVYTFGETPRGGGGITSRPVSPGNASFPFRAPGATTSAAGGSGTSLRTTTRAHPGAGGGSGRGGSVVHAENSPVLDYHSPPASAAILSTPPLHRTCSQYRLVPGLERMDVRGIVGGLYHTFVFAEELDFSDEATFGKEE